ncbi:hypothetical protein H0H93_006417 [Arthromyces matolae]|nr:hypothetical protein H0H93_006417 [Arthromyces matolae]
MQVPRAPTLCFADLPSLQRKHTSMKTFFTFLVPIVLATSAYAHGIVTQITIDGTVYAGNTLNGNISPSIIRAVNTNSPVKGASNKDLNCGTNASPASLVGNAMPGSKLQFTWGSGYGGNWPHTTGPVMTYLASCGSQTCDKFDSTTAKWFKIDQQARGSDGSWAQAAIASGSPASLSLPSNLAPGNYLMRHEIISLQNAVSVGGAEFYPSCSQITVGGSQSGTPTSNDLVSFPGGYSDNDPGIYDPNVYDPGSSYTFPGPPMASFISGSSSSSSGGSSSPSNPTVTKTVGGATASGTATASSTTSTKPAGAQCRLMIRKTVTSSTSPLEARTIRPRHISRIMRGLIANIKRS